MKNEMQTFELDGSDYIELKNLLKASGLCDNGAEAKDVISQGLVKVDGVTETRKACKIKAGQRVEYKGQAIQVS